MATNFADDGVGTTRKSYGEGNPKIPPESNIKSQLQEAKVTG